MTIQELEQAVRNLIATQPMVTAGANGEVVNGVLSLIDAVKNINFRVQTYPCQDVLKFTMTNESAKFENNLCNLVCQVMQERGINLMLYIAQPQNRFGPMVNQYGMINQQIDPNLMMGQMMYSQPAPQTQPMATMMQMPNGMGGMYNQMQPQMQGVGAGFGRTPRRQAPTFPGYDYGNKPAKIAPVQATEQSLRSGPVSQARIKTTPKANVSSEIGKVNKTMPEQVAEMETFEPKTPSTAEMLMDTGTTAKTGKSSGRDYLMELLKK